MRSVARLVLLVSASTVLAACHDQLPTDLSSSSSSEPSSAPESAPETATLSVSPASLQMVAGSGTPGTFTVTNGSTTVTATAITADLSGTPLAGAVTVDDSACTSVAPGASCLITFTPGNTAVTATSFPIQGTNTNTVGGKITITLPASAMISVTGSPLVLTASYGTAASGTLTVTNDSTVLTATNISAALVSPLAGVVTEDASGCASVAPGASCTLSFTPTGTAAVAATPVVVQGDNTSQAGASIAVNAATGATLSVSGSPLVLAPGGAAGTITVTNSSATLTATNITTNLTGTALAGAVTEDASNCAALAPGASCTISFTPGSTLVSSTAVSVAGDHTNTLTADIGIAVQVGDSYLGGVVYQVNGDGTSGLVVSSSDVSASDGWGGAGTTTGASSNTDGAANTTTIVSVLGTGGGSYAALDCYDYITAGASLGTWYLPALYELQTLVATVLASGNPAFGTLAGTYWSSTEYTTSPDSFAWFIATSNQNTGSFSKTGTLSVRCIRAF